MNYSHLQADCQYTGISLYLFMLYNNSKHMLAGSTRFAYKTFTTEVTEN